MCSYTHTDLPPTPADKNASQRKNGKRGRQQRSKMYSHTCARQSGHVTNVRVKIIVFLWTMMLHLLSLMSDFTNNNNNNNKRKKKNNSDDVMQA